MLKIWHGMSFREIGDALGIPSDTAASRWRYGLANAKSDSELFTGNGWYLYMGALSSIAQTSLDLGRAPDEEAPALDEAQRKSVEQE